MMILNNKALRKFTAVLLALVMCVSLSLSFCTAFAAESTAQPVTEVATVPETQSKEEPAEGEILVYKNLFQYEIEKDNNVEYVSIVKYIGDGGEVSIPQTIDGRAVYKIGMEAFWKCESLTAVNIPSGVMYIAERAFQYCSNLEYVNLPDSVIEINVAAFEVCEKLKDITLPANLLYIGSGAFDRTQWIEQYEGSSSVILDDKFFYRYDGDAEMVTIPDGIISISSNAFAGNKNIKYVHIPESVQFFGGFCFYNCPNLKSLSIPDNTAFAGDYAFGVDSLDKDGKPVYTEDFVLYANDGTYGDLEYCKRFDVVRKERKYNATPDELPEAETGSNIRIDDVPEGKLSNVWVFVGIVIGCAVVVGGLYAFFTIKEKKEKEMQKRKKSANSKKNGKKKNKKKK